jgi:rhodanese-related sulfurtransferase
VDFLQNNILLIAVAFISGAMLIWPMVRRSAGGPWVSTVEATQLINRQDALVLDVRSADEFAKEHILGAKSLPLAELERRAGELEKYKSKAVIVHCENGNRATSAVAMLRKQGYASVVNLAGGFAAWKQAGLPVQK